MAASATLPYFAKPSVALSAVDKQAAYNRAISEIKAVLGDETDPMVKMVTINCLLKTHLPYYFWVGFYLVKNGQLVVGPYQGTLGCLTIEFGRGVCGKAAQTGQTQIVDDVHALEQGTQHIACDPNSRSEIVVPVFNAEKELIAVFDVDSTLPDSFDEVDKANLERLFSLMCLSICVLG
ncbi:MAG: GAF domain-containing protein [Bacteroidota bacterium]